MASLVVLLLAGCLGGGKEPAPAEGAEAGLASIAGVVVSPAIVPLANVSLSLSPAGLNATSDGEGRFAFEGLQEGPYTLVATLAGFLPSTLVVEAGDDLVKVVLEPDRQVGSYVETYVFDGFLEWAITAGGARSSNSVDPNYTIGVRPPDLIQSEMVWDSTQALGNALELTAIANDGGVAVPDFARSIGPSPLLMTINSSVILQYKLGPGVRLDYAAFAGADPNPEGRGAGVALSQSYRLVTHMFYGYLPPDGWRFTVDGDPPPPPT